VGQWNEYTNPGRPDIEISLIEIKLAYSFGETYDFSALRGTTRSFRGKNRSQKAVYMHSAEVGALSRVRGVSQGFAFEVS
jgi:hypothetical protein